MLSIWSWPWRKCGTVVLALGAFAVFAVLFVVIVLNWMLRPTEIRTRLC